MSIPRHLISKLEEVFRGDKDVSRSPLQHLLKPNAAAPSDSEVIAIRALISEAEARIEDLHRHFPARNRASKVKESQLLKIIEIHRELLSPVRYLPSEILQEIFLHYSNNPRAVVIAEMPWRLGHVSHRWREVALSLPSLWDNIPKVEVFHTNPKRSYVRALICLIRRSGTSPTLKFDLTAEVLGSLREAQKSLINKEIILHSERIEQLRIDINDKSIRLFQGFKRRLPNLRILRVHWQFCAHRDLDIFETAPALRQVTIGGSYSYHFGYVRAPQLHITCFEDRLTRTVGQLPMSSLRLLTYLDIHQVSCYFNSRESAIRFPYRPTTLPNLRTLTVMLDSDYETANNFLQSLTIPAVEVMKIFYVAPLIPHLVSMFSGARGPTRLQKLTFRTIPLQTGELSSLLRLTPHLVELDIDIDVPPVDDLLNLIYGMGEVMLVPMLQGLHMHIPEITADTQTEHFHTLAEVRCELPELGDNNDSDDDTMPSLEPRTRTTLDTLRFVFKSAESRDNSQKILNNWLFSFTPEEANLKAKDIYIINPGHMISRMISRCGYNYFPSPLLIKPNNADINMISDQFLDSLEDELAFLEDHGFASKVVLVRLFFWMLACKIFTLI